MTALSYPADLPITERRGDLLDAIGANQVVVVAGETGSGKSTQLPKLCLELGRGVDGLIGHTQPRRLAARSIAERVAEELGTEIGGAVGYAVRFDDRVGDATRVKLMTDGLLLAEVQHDRTLRRYDTIIIDEAHERSLNIDFLLGYLTQLLPRRPDLKVIITSATIDTERFAAHFDDAPIIEVSGRTYPVEYRYRPVDGSDGRPGRDQPQGICDAVEELITEGPGDILVFCSGERDIRDAAEALDGLRLAATEIFPLFARLSSAEQHRVFKKHRGRRIVLATNVAETSLTVPGIRYVVDPGNARISRYSNRTKVQRLPIEAVSRASADQRAGRCGRVGPGVCIRLYSEEDYLGRPEFTEPEITRTNLASVILRMAALGLGDVEAFPFVDPPDRRNIRDGIALLEELNAVDPDRHGTKRWLTPMGRQLAELPIDPRLARMVVEAGENGCLHEVTVIAAALSIQDPRERPADKRQAADELHARFTHPDSDLLGHLALWDYFHAERTARGSSQFRKMCRREHLNFMRLREWQDIHGQLRRVARSLHLTPSDEPATPDRIHRSLLAGLLSHIGMQDTTDNAAFKGRRGNVRPKGRKRVEYRGARGAKFAIAAGSTLANSAPGWVMAAELVETNRLWARGVARIDPQWAEQVGQHLATYTYGEPWWDADGGVAMVHEGVTLYGLPIIAKRPVPVGRVDAELARELFIHHALVAREWDAPHAFLEHNANVLTRVEALGARSRRHDLVVENQAVFDFYDARVGSDVVSTRHFDTWWKDTARTDPELLDLSVEALVENPDAIVDAEAFPETWHTRVDGTELDLAIGYELDPDSSTDGVTVTIPVGVVHQLDPAMFDWSVPGFRREVVTTLIRSLPKDLRKPFVPIPETVDAVLPKLDPADGSLLETLSVQLSRMGAIAVDPNDLDLARVEPHLRPNLKVVDDSGDQLLVSKNLGAIVAALRRHAMASLAREGHELERSGLRSWSIGTLPRVVETTSAGYPVRAHPALVDAGDDVAVRLFATEAEQLAAHRLGLRRLVRLGVSTPAKRFDRLLPDETKLALAKGSVQSTVDWYNDAIDCALDALIDANGGVAWTEADFSMLVDAVTRQLDDTLPLVAEAVGRLVARIEHIDRLVDDAVAPALQPAVRDVRAHLSQLVYPGFLAGVGLDRLDDIGRYLDGIERRLSKLRERVPQDRRIMQRCTALELEYEQLGESLPPSGALEDVGWMLQELRVSLFAPSIGAKGPVSERRIRQAMIELGP
ncbi:MAG: ATP-dependent RNA helicase HrpA [Acidimicrobiia bacterium]|nr:ATP-dependent RNA helicase HrpA [Acidimicrobiia bacterium]